MPPNFRCLVSRFSPKHPRCDLPLITLHRFHIDATNPALLFYYWLHLALEKSPALPLPCSSLNLSLTLTHCRWLISSKVTLLPAIGVSPGSPPWPIVCTQPSSAMLTSACTPPLCAWILLLELHCVRIFATICALACAQCSLYVIAQACLCLSMLLVSCTLLLCCFLAKLSNVSDLLRTTLSARAVCLAQVTARTQYDRQEYFKHRQWYDKHRQGSYNDRRRARWGRIWSQRSRLS